MTFWSCVLVGGILLWIAVGKLANSDGLSGKLFRRLVEAGIERVRGKPNPPEDEQ